MSKIRVCVIALTRHQRTSVVPLELRDALMRQPTDVVYGNTPDDWCPFIDGETVLGYVKSAGFDVVSVSGQMGDWSNADKVDGLIKNIDLFLIDPLFLALSTLAGDVLPRLDQTIFTGERAFCIARHRGIPSAHREMIDDLCRKTLRSTFKWYQDEGEGEFKAEDLDRLKVSLKRMLRKLGNDLPNPARLEMIARLMASEGVSFPSDRVPRLGTSL